MKFLPNVLLISGTGRKVGKTSLACSILKNVGGEHRVIAVKITPHNHFDTLGMELLDTGEGYCLYQQLRDNGRDTSRMLMAGAHLVYLLQIQNKTLDHGFMLLLERHDPNTLFLVESGGLSRYIRPGVFCLVTDSRMPVKENISQAIPDILLDETHFFDVFCKKLVVVNNAWTMGS